MNHLFFQPFVGKDYVNGGIFGKGSQGQVLLTHWQ